MRRIIQDYIFGVTVGNDVTSPEYFREDGHWFVGKSFPSFTPLGPVIETDVVLLSYQLLLQ